MSVKAWGLRSVRWRAKNGECDSKIILILQRSKSECTCSRVGGFLCAVALWRMIQLSTRRHWPNISYSNRHCTEIWTAGERWGISRGKRQTHSGRTRTRSPMFSASCRSRRRTWLDIFSNWVLYWCHLAVPFRHYVFAGLRSALSLWSFGHHCCGYRSGQRAPDAFIRKDRQAEMLREGLGEGESVERKAADVSVTERGSEDARTGPFSWLRGAIFGILRR